MMSEFRFDNTNDWDLNAIVKGRATTSNVTPSNVSFDSLSIEDYQGGHENSAFILNELNPQNNHGILLSQNIVDSSLVEFDVYNSSKSSCPAKEAQTKAIDDVISCANSRAITKSRRRKNKHKIMKVVQQAGGDRVESDKWNWRKYGEKVIKGSPYPRSYYRCSYTGGCSARKQVEQSCKDPSLFLITYMEEHTHPFPIRRHSQAGRSSRKINHHASSHNNNNNINNVLKTPNESYYQNINFMMMKNTTNSSESSIKYVDGDDDDDDGRSNAKCYVGEGDGDVSNGNGECEDDFFEGLDYLEGFNMDFYDL